MIKNPLLIFDLGNVFIRHDNKLLIDSVAAHCADAAQAGQALTLALKSDHSLSTGQTTLPEFYRAKLRPLNFTGSYEDFEALWNSHFSAEPGMQDFAQALVKKYRTVLLSNTNHAHWAYIIPRYPVMQMLHTLYASFELRVAKPDRAIYEHVLRAEGCAAGDAIFIDDLVENIAGAEAVGITGILFRGRPALEQSLAALGVTA